MKQRQACIQGRADDGHVFFLPNLFSQFIISSSSSFVCPPSSTIVMRLPSLQFLVAASAAGAAALLLARILRLRARSSCNRVSSGIPLDSTLETQSLHSQTAPIFACDAAAAEERMRTGARIRGEPCVLDVCSTNAAEYRRGGCDMIVRDFIEAGASEWAANALRCILVARGADQAFR
jgi:hypothetical protein